MLVDLAGWKQRPSCFTTMAYELCSAISENYSRLADGKELLFLSLQIGFRHLDPNNPRVPTKLTHTEHHQHMADIIFESADSEVIADLLHAWTSHSDSHEPFPSLAMCVRHLVGLRPSSRRLRRLVIRAVGSIGYQKFEQAGLPRFFGLLDHLDASIEDVDDKEVWATLLLDIIRSSDRHLSPPYWELLVELSLSGSLQSGGVAWDPAILTNLEASQEWGKLVCWMGIAWIVWPPESDVTPEGVLRDALLSLSRHRPGAIPKLEEWIERWSVSHGKAVPETFQRISGQARFERGSGSNHNA